MRLFPSLGSGRGRVVLQRGNAVSLSDIVRVAHTDSVTPLLVGGPSLELCLRSLSLASFLSSAFQHPKPCQKSVSLTAVLSGRSWMSPREQWPVHGSSPWPSLRSARTSTRATTRTTSLQPLWWPRRLLAFMSLPPPNSSPRKCDSQA